MGIWCRVSRHSAHTELHGYAAYGPRCRATNASLYLWLRLLKVSGTTTTKLYTYIQLSYKLLLQ